MVAALVAAGANVSATFKSATPLLYMMQRIRSGLWGAKDYGNNAVEFSEAYGQYWTGQYLDEAATPCQPGHCTDWCQQMAGVVQQLVAAGARVDVLDGDNCSTPLFCAAAGGCPTLVTALLQAGADPGSTTPTGYTLLHAAAHSGKLRVVQQVLGLLGSSRASGMMRALGGTRLQGLQLTPLHRAAAGGYLEVAEALVAAGADRDQQDTEGATPLHRALVKGHCHLVPLLVTPGNVNKLWRASKSDKSSSCTPLYLAVECLTPSDSWQEWVGPRLADAARAVEVLLAAGAEVHALGKRGVTPLEAAAAEGHPAILQMLLRHTLQHHKQQQQQQSPPKQEQQCDSDKEDEDEPKGEPRLRLQLCDAALMALTKRGDLAHGTAWGDYWSLILETLGMATAALIWINLQDMLLKPETVTGLTEGVREALECHLPDVLGDRVRTAWVVAWTAACKEDPQRTQTLERLQRLFNHPPKQGSGSPPPERSRNSKPPRLIRELKQMMRKERRQAATAAAAAGAGSSSSKAARAEARRVGAVMKELEAAAADGDLQRVRAALGQLPDRATGLSAAAVAAGKAEQYWVHVESMEELVVLDEGMAAAVVATLQEHSHPYPEVPFSRILHVSIMRGDKE